LNAAAAGARPGAEATSTGEWSAADEAPPQPYQYDEWDYAIGLSRPAWCTVLDRRGRFGDADRISNVLARNQDTLTRLARLVKLAQVDRPRCRRQQIEGEQLDLDACVAATVDLRAGRAPQPHVYQRAGRGGRDLAALLLLDLSESTNQYVPSAGATVLTLAVEATTLVGHAMATIGDTFAIHGFSSAGRSAVEYHRFKDFDEPYDDHVHARLAAIQGRLSTRMGAAVRHAGHFLRFRRVARKLILVVTDGRPHDIDVHDHQYLVFDAKRAVDEQARTGIATFCISLDAGADDYVGRIFGARNYVVLDRLHRLPEIVPRLYFRLRQ
jgi:nitric oxide reductase activation protein